MAQQIDDYLPLIETINQSAIQVVEYLQNHPNVANVYWSKEERSRAHYQLIERTPQSIGSMISFELNIELARFYDRLTLSKGPSFGMKRSLACPFMYLAHYDLVSTKEGQAYLDQAGIKADLIRFSIGGEPVNEIIDALDYALQ